LPEARAPTRPWPPLAPAPLDGPLRDVPGGKAFWMTDAEFGGMIYVVVVDAPGDAAPPLVLEFGPTRMAFCTDDREPEHVAEEGHINSMVRRAVEAGVPVEDALANAFALVGEGQLRPLARAGLRDAVGDGAVGKHARD